MRGLSASVAVEAMDVQAHGLCGTCRNGNKAGLRPSREFRMRLPGTGSLREIIHLDGQVGNRRVGAALACEAYLYGHRGRRCIGANPAMIHRKVEAENVAIERFGFRGILGEEIRDDPSDFHVTPPLMRLGRDANFVEAINQLKKSSSHRSNVWFAPRPCNCEA